MTGLLVYSFCCLWLFVFSQLREKSRTVVQLFEGGCTNLLYRETVVDPIIKPFMVSRAPSKVFLSFGRTHGP